MIEASSTEKSENRSRRILPQNILGTAAFLILLAPAFVQAQQDNKKPLEKVRLTVPAKSLTFVP